MRHGRLTPTHAHQPGGDARTAGAPAWRPRACGAAPGAACAGWRRRARPPPPPPPPPWARAARAPPRRPRPPRRRPLAPRQAGRPGRQLPAARARPRSCGRAPAAPGGRRPARKRPGRAPAGPPRAPSRARQWRRRRRAAARARRRLRRGWCRLQQGSLCRPPGLHARRPRSVRPGGAWRRRTPLDGRACMPGLLDPRNRGQLTLQAPHGSWKPEEQPVAGARTGGARISSARQPCLGGPRVAGRLRRGSARRAARSAAAAPAAGAAGRRALACGQRRWPLALPARLPGRWHWARSRAWHRRAARQQAAPHAHAPAGQGRTWGGGPGA